MFDIYLRDFPLIKLHKMEYQKRSSKRKLVFILNVLPMKKSMKDNPYYDLVLQVGENESSKIVGYNQKLYDKVKELFEKKSLVKIETKVLQKDNSLFFNSDCNV